MKNFLCILLLSCVSIFKSNSQEPKQLDLAYVMYNLSIDEVQKNLQKFKYEFNGATEVKSSEKKYIQCTFVKKSISDTIPDNKILLWRQKDSIEFEILQLLTPSKELYDNFKNVFEKTSERLFDDTKGNCIIVHYKDTSFFKSVENCIDNGKKFYVITFANQKFIPLK